MNFIMSLFNAATKDKASQAEVEAINKLKKKLVEVGFAPGEVNYMVKKYSKKKKLEDLSNTEIEEIKAALSKQLEIAYKCINLTKEK